MPSGPSTDTTSASSPRIFYGGKGGVKLPGKGKAVPVRPTPPEAFPTSLIAHPDPATMPTSSSTKLASMLFGYSDDDDEDDVFDEVEMQKSGWARDQEW